MIPDRTSVLSALKILLLSRKYSGTTRYMLNCFEASDNPERRQFFTQKKEELGKMVPLVWTEVGDEDVRSELPKQFKNHYHSSDCLTLFKADLEMYFIWK